MRIISLFLVATYWTNVFCAEEARAVPTFEYVGLYWKPNGGDSANTCAVSYRVRGTTVWREAMPMWFDVAERTGAVAEHGKEYRGSIVGLAPATTYEIQLKLEKTGMATTIEAKTWDEVFPVARTVVIAADTPQPYVITEGGSAATGYVVYELAAGKALNGGGSATSNITVNASYVVLRGLTLSNAQRHGIQLGDVQDIVIDDCDISGWGRTASDCPFGVNLDSAIYSSSKHLERIVVQNTRMHHPRSNSNSWTESRPHDGRATKHPIGPQGISFVGGLGRYVIRNNRVWSDDAHKFNDGMGETNNFSYAGFPNRDSDIYGNHISHAYDDGAEIEGADMNVRVWGNHFSEVYGSIGAATASLGPLYIWRNVMTTARKGPGSDADANKGAYLVKLGNEDPAWGLGSIFIFHNTMVQPPARAGFTGTSGGQHGLLWTSATKRQNNVTSRNNIFYVRSATDASIRDTSRNPSNTFDYDLYNGGATGDGTPESHGIHGLPIFAESYPETYPLAINSPGRDAGIRLPNFNDDFTGSAPDAGAFESTASTTLPPATPSTPPTVTPVSENAGSTCGRGAGLAFLLFSTVMLCAVTRKRPRH